MKKSIYLVGILMLLFCANAFGQLNLPRDSQRAEVAQIVGDTRIAFVYHRPNTKGRVIWGCQTNDLVPTGETTYPCLVPNGQVWRTGANENTTFETNHDLRVNGQTLPAGKYGLHTIPGKDEWTIIFSKTNDSWGSFSYKQENDQLRIKAKPQTVAESQETMSLGLENIKATTADFVIRWEKLRVPFTIDVGDVSARVIGDIRTQLKNLKADDSRTPVTAANYIYSQKMTANYAEAIGWLDQSLKTKETANALGLKAYLQAETGNKAEAIANAERAIIVAKAANPKADTTQLEKRIAEWKANK
ncbi:MAG: DUF2911 domain-containing protein [Acidobacteriota bacterium]|nr:DUF2911 domain-containing protein [Acidobacteriota bacterium]